VRAGCAPKSRDCLGGCEAVAPTVVTGVVVVVVMVDILLLVVSHVGAVELVPKVTVQCRRHALRVSVGGMTREVGRRAFARRREAAACLGNRHRPRHDGQLVLATARGSEYRTGSALASKDPATDAGVTPRASVSRTTQATGICDSGSGAAARRRGKINRTGKASFLRRGSASDPGCLSKLRLVRASGRLREKETGVPKVGRGVRGGACRDQALLQLQSHLIATSGPGLFI
jgi:hypothetical protein